MSAFGTFGRCEREDTCTLDPGCELYASCRRSEGGNEEGREMADVWLVVMDRGGIFGAWVGDGSETRANEAAEAIEGVVCRLRVYADYRPSQEAVGHG